MADVYRCVVSGTKQGAVFDQVVSGLQKLAGMSREEIALRLRQGGWVFRNGLNLAGAESVCAALRNVGCDCSLEFETQKINEELTLRRFFSQGFGLILDAPEDWQDASADDAFKVVDPKTRTVIEAFAYKNPGVTLERWSELRTDFVKQHLPFFQVSQSTYAVEGDSWKGLLTEYRGVPPDAADMKIDYLLLCIANEDLVLVVELSSLSEVFDQIGKFYRWLLINQVRLLEVVKVPAG